MLGQQGFKRSLMAARLAPAEKIRGKIPLKLGAKDFARRSLPLKIMMGYLLTTYLLFAFGPISWPIESWITLNLYLTVAAFVFSVTYLYSTYERAHGCNFASWKLIYIVGAVASVGLLFPSAIIYTGRWPWEVFEAWQDQKEAYLATLNQISLTEGQRGLIALARGLAGPFVMAVMPLGFLHWKEMSWSRRSLILTTISSYLIFSVLRGTSRQLADVLILCSSGALVVYNRASPSQHKKRRGGPTGSTGCSGAPEPSSSSLPRTLSSIAFRSAWAA